MGIFVSCLGFWVFFNFLFYACLCGCWEKIYTKTPFLTKLSNLGIITFSINRALDSDQFSCGLFVCGHFGFSLLSEYIYIFYVYVRKHRIDRFRISSFMGSFWVVFNFDDGPVFLEVDYRYRLCLR